MNGPHVIKFVSIDKLVAYQLWPSRDRMPEPVIDRIGYRLMRLVSINPSEIPMDNITRRRSYELYDRYCDEKNGNIVWEYRERL